ncbi:MAG: holo-ACP synthase [Deltaproteobacteria bacterium]
MDLACGVDIIEIERVKRAIERDEGRFLNKVFTAEEVKYCSKASLAKYQHFAARFAAKEAVAKALGLGLAGGVILNEIEVVKDEKGKPSIVLYGSTKKIAEDMGISSWSLSLSHCKEYAIANVVCSIKTTQGENQ